MKNKHSKTLLKEIIQEDMILHKKQTNVKLKKLDINDLSIGNNHIIIIIYIIIYDIS